MWIRGHLGSHGIVLIAALRVLLLLLLHRCPVLHHGLLAHVRIILLLLRLAHHWLLHHRLSHHWLSHHWLLHHGLAHHWLLHHWLLHHRLAHHGSTSVHGLLHHRLAHHGSSVHWLLLGNAHATKHHSLLTRGCHHGVGCDICLVFRGASRLPFALEVHLARLLSLVLDREPVVNATICGE